MKPRRTAAAAAKDEISSVSSEVDICLDKLALHTPSADGLYLDVPEDEIFNN